MFRTIPYFPDKALDVVIGWHFHDTYWIIKSRKLVWDSGLVRSETTITRQKKSINYFENPPVELIPPYIGLDLVCWKIKLFGIGIKMNCHINPKWSTGPLHNCYSKLKLELELCNFHIFLDSSRIALAAR